MCSHLKNCFKPITRENLLYYYQPAVGSASHAFLAVSVLNPAYSVSFLSKRDVTNILITSSLVGTGLYISKRLHLSAASPKNRIIFSTFGATTFTFSSILLWAILRSFLPQNGLVCTVAGVASSYLLIRGGQSYFEYVDSQVNVKK